MSLAGVDAGLTPPHIQQQQVVQVDQQLLHKKKITNKIQARFSHPDPREKKSEIINKSRKFLKGYGWSRGWVMFQDFYFTPE